MNQKNDKKESDFSEENNVTENKNELDFLLKPEDENYSLPDNEWQQEYFIIYNSYILE